MNQETESRRQWHLGKEVPLATIFVLMVQTAGVIWWAASTAAKVDFMEKTYATNLIMQTQVDRRQDDDNQRSENRIMGQLTAVNQKLDRLIEAKK